MEDVDQLIRRVRAGEVEVYAEIVRRFERPVWRVVAALLQGDERGGEVMQQVFVDAYIHLGQYRLNTDFAAWIKEVARNRVRQELRRLGREAKHLRAYGERLERRLRDDGESDRHEEMYLDALRACREQLPENSARALACRYDKGMSFDEIAESFEMTRAAAEKLLSRVRIALKECIETRLANP